MYERDESRGRGGGGGGTCSMDALTYVFTGIATPVALGLMRSGREKFAVSPTSKMSVSNWQSTNPFPMLQLKSASTVDVTVA